MKTAISIPDDVFAGAERLARRTKKSRSQLFSDAVREYLARHTAEEVTDEFTSLAARRILEKTEW
jgi:metal-responsive CopG/Arc/MetJ family transcriptional regulator